MPLYVCRLCRTDTTSGRWFAYTGVGFCVARSTEMGNAKALIAERAKDRFPTLLLCYLVSCIGDERDEEKMKKFSVLLSDPTAPEFQKTCEKAGETIVALAKAGILTSVDLSFEESRENAVKTAFEETGIVNLTELISDNE